MEVKNTDGKLYEIESGANLSGVDLSRVDLSGANLRNANLRNANLSGANLSGANLSDANLRNTDFGSADLTGADLGSADLTGADLGSADLTGADLWYSDLSSVNLIDADLSDANLRNANLSDANLTDANLSGANLIDANLRNTDLKRVKYDDKTAFPRGFDLSNISSSKSYEGGVNSVDQSIYHESSSRTELVSDKRMTGISLLRCLAWIWMIVCPLGGFGLWGQFGSSFGFALFLSATLSGLVTFAVFLVLCTIAENLIEINKAVTSSNQSK